jgi:hypothetical protein
MTYPVALPHTHSSSNLVQWCPVEVVVEVSQPQPERHWDESLQTQITWTDSSVQEERSVRIIRPFPETSSSRRRLNSRDTDDDTITTAPRRRSPLRDISLEWQNRSNCQSS